MTKQPPFRAWCYCGSDTCSDFIFSVLFLSSRGELSHVLHTSTCYCHVGPSWVPGQRQAVPSYLLSGTAPQRTGGSESGRCVVRTVSSGLWGRRGDTSVVSLEGDESPLTGGPSQHWPSPQPGTEACPRARRQARCAAVGVSLDTSAGGPWTVPHGAGVSFPVDSAYRLPTFQGL